MASVKLISVIRPEYVFPNVESVRNYAGRDTSDLRTDFLSSINRLQKYSFKFDPKRPSIYLNFGRNQDLNRELLEEITDGGDSFLNGNTILQK